MLTLTSLKSGWRPWLICQIMAPRWHWTSCGRDKLCLFDLLSSEPRLALSHTGDMPDFRAHRWSRRVWWKGGVRPCPDFTSYTLAFALLLRKIAVNPSQVSRKALGSIERTCCCHYIGGYGRCRVDVYERFRNILEVSWETYFEFNGVWYAVKRLEGFCCVWVKYRLLWYYRSNGWQYCDVAKRFDKMGQLLRSSGQTDPKYLRIR